MIPPRILQVLVVTALLLPITICVVAATGKLLDALQDPSGAILLGRLALGIGLIWVIDLILLSISQGINGLYDRPDDHEQE